MKRVYLPVFLLAFTLALSAQSPWARSRAGFYVQAGYHFIPEYGSLFGAGSEDIVLDHLVSEKQWQLYGEYGITRKTTLIVSLPFVWNERGEDNPDSPYMFGEELMGRIGHIGNATLALRHQFLQGPVAVGGTLRLGLPAAGGYIEFADLRAGYDAVTIQQLLSIGKGWNRFYGYLYGGYTYRSNDYSHSLNAGIEAGVKLGPIRLIGFSELMFSLKNGDRSLPSIDVLTGLYANDQEWMSVGVKAIWEVGRFWGIGVSGAGATWAHLVPKSPGLSAMAYFKWD